MIAELIAALDNRCEACGGSGLDGVKQYACGCEHHGFWKRCAQHVATPDFAESVSASVPQGEDTASETSAATDEQIADAIRRVRKYASDARDLGTFWRGQHEDPNIAEAEECSQRATDLEAVADAYESAAASLRSSREREAAAVLSRDVEWDRAKVARVRVAELESDLVALRSREAAPVDAIEVLTLDGAQVNHALGWLSDAPDGEKSDDTLIKITDGKGRAICTLTAGWLKRLADLPQPERQAPTWEPDSNTVSRSPSGAEGRPNG